MRTLDLVKKLELDDYEIEEGKNVVRLIHKTPHMEKERDISIAIVEIGGHHYLKIKGEGNPKIGKHKRMWLMNKDGTFADQKHKKAVEKYIAEKMHGLRTIKEEAKKEAYKEAENAIIR